MTGFSPCKQLGGWPRSPGAIPTTIRVPPVARCWGPGRPRTPCERRASGCRTAGGGQSFADHFPRRAHNQSMNTLSSRALPQSLSPSVPQSLSPLVPQSLGPLVPWSLSYPHPPLWKSPGILHGFCRKTPVINQLTFLSVNYPVNFNPGKRPLFCPKVSDLGAKRKFIRPFCALRLRPLDKCRPQAHPDGAPSISCTIM